MAWSTVLEAAGVANGAVTASESLALTNPVSTGDLVICLYECEGNPGAASATISDNKGGNTWHQDLIGTGGSYRLVVIWSTTVVNGGSGFQVTVTPNVSVANNVALHRYANPGGTVTSESSSSNYSATSAPITAGSLTIATGPDLVVVEGGAANNDINSAGSGFTLQKDIATGSDYFATEDQIGVSSGLNPAFGITTSTWICGAVAYKFAASGPTMATLSGPTVGLIGVTSTNFTITLDQAAQSGGVSCPITSSHSGDTITSTPVVITIGNLTGTFTVTPSPHNLGDTGTRNITLGTTTPSLTITGSPIAYLAQAYYPAALMLGL